MTAANPAITEAPAVEPRADLLAAVGLPEVRRAHDRVRDVVRRTPLERSRWLSGRVGAPVHLKLECWQRTHSFKIRGALNAVRALDEESRGRGLVTASAGNHGQAVALAAELTGATATVFVPRSAPEAKKSRIRQYGAELREVDGSYDDAAARATAHAQHTGATLVHPFTDPRVVAGQATAALEILEDLPDVRTVVVPVGGGGLAAGAGIVVRAMAPDARVVGVQSTATHAMHAALEAGRVVPTPVVPTLCDGLAGEVEPATFGAAQSLLDAVVLVEEAAVAPAIRHLYRREGLVAEGSGAVGVAALLEGLIPAEGPTAVIISGGNIDAATLADILAAR